MNTTPVFDALIIGSGAGGCAAAYKLATAGLRVALVEKGRALPHDSSTLDFDKVVHQGFFRSQERWHDGKGREFSPEEHFNVGGKTKWYGAALLRYGRDEFGNDDAHQCLGWPFAYDELAPYYDEAERLLGVRVFDAESDLQRIVSRLQSRRDDWSALPLQLGLNASILDNRIEASRFDGFASPTDLKSDGQTSFLARLSGYPNFTLLTGEPVVDLTGAAHDPRRITGVRLGDGRLLRADMVLLGAGALHSPRLLQRYVDRHELAASLPGAQLIGRYLKLHLLTALVAISATRKHDLLRKTILLLNRRLPHSSIQPLGFDGELISQLFPGFMPRSLARQLGDRAYGFFLQTEDGAHFENRVHQPDPSHGNHPVLDYEASRVSPALKEHSQLVARFRRALVATGMAAFSQRIGLAGTAHASGTLITGANPATSVVDPDGRVRGLHSLYVVDGSVLPRSSRVNPALTIYAWGLRVATLLAARTAANVRAQIGDMVSA